MPQVLFNDESSRLLRDWDTGSKKDMLVAEVIERKDRMGTPVWRSATPEEEVQILRAAVLDLDNKRRDEDNRRYQEAEDESLRRARGR